MDKKDIETWDTACNLYDGGWRSGDKDLLIEEYGLTEEQADGIVDALDRIEYSEKEKAEDEYLEAMDELARMNEGNETISAMLQCVIDRNNKYKELYEHVLVLARVFPEMPISEAVRQVEKRRDA